MRPFKPLATLLVLALILAMELARADDLVLDAPHIEAGDRTAEMDLTYGAGNGRLQNGYFGQRYGVNYGVTDQWETSLFGEFEHEPDNQPYASHVEWENIFAPFRPGTYWLDFGFFTEIDKSTNDQTPDNFEARLLLEKDAGPWENLANVIFTRNFGLHADSATRTGFAWITAYKFSENFDAGLQYTNDLGALDPIEPFAQQEELLGPIMYGKLGELEYTSGVLLGLSQGSPAATARLDLEYGF